MSSESKEIGILRPIEDSELELMLCWRNDSTVRANMYQNHKISLSEHLSWWKRINNSDHHQYFMYESNGIQSGIVGFTNIDSENKNSFWAFYASPAAPKGAGSRMELLALDYAFNELCLHKLCCEVLDFNKSVIKLHKKFGFKVEGIFRDQYLRGNTFIDVYRLSMLASEWADTQHEMRAKISRLLRG